MTYWHYQQLHRSTVLIIAVLLCIVLVLYVSRFSDREYSAAHDAISCTNILRPRNIITKYDSSTERRLSELVAKRATSSDPDLINLIRQLLIPPSQHMLKIARGLEHTPQSVEIDKIFHGKTGGFYIECGALDGERGSNTLFLEQKRGWTGLLVEMDPYFYTQLVGKSRNSWSINACLSPKPYVTQVAFTDSTENLDQLMSSEPNNQRSAPYSMVACFPLNALLMAMNRTTVDYFSLDIQGYELDILRTIPFPKVNIRTLSVGFASARSDNKPYVDFMDQHGYHTYKTIHFENWQLKVHDFIFVNFLVNMSAA